MALFTGGIVLAASSASQASVTLTSQNVMTANVGFSGTLEQGVDQTTGFVYGVSGGQVAAATYSQTMSQQSPAVISSGSGFERATVNQTTEQVFASGSTLGYMWQLAGATGGTPGSQFSSQTPTVVNYPSVSGSPATGAGMMKTNSATNTVWVTFPSLGKVAAYNVAAGTWSSMISVGTNPTALAVDSVSNRVYVANTGANTVSVINGATGSVSSTWSVGSTPTGIDVDPAASAVYVVEQGAADLAALNSTTGAVLNRVAFTSGTHPFSVAVDPARLEAFVDFTDQDGLDVVDTTTSSALTTTHISAGQYGSTGIGGGAGLGVIVDPTRTVAYAATAGSAYVFGFTGTGAYLGYIDNGYPVPNPPTHTEVPGLNKVSSIPDAYGDVAYQYQVPLLLSYIGSFNYFTGLPPGLSIGTNGLITGTDTTAAGTYAVTLHAHYQSWGQPSGGGVTQLLGPRDYSNANTAQTANLGFTIVVHPGVPVLNTTNPAHITPGAAYSASITSTWQDHFTLSNSTLPSGITFNTSTGVLSGTSTTAGSYSFTVTPVNSDGVSGAPNTYTVVVDSPTPPTISLADPASTKNGKPYTSTTTSYLNLTNAQASGSPGTWSVTGTLPTGLFLDTSNPSSPRINGTITAAVGANFSFALVLTNSAGSATRSFNVSVSAQAPSALSNGGSTGVPNFSIYEGIPFNYTPNTTGTPPFTYTAPTLTGSYPNPFPSGISMTSTSTGTISGTAAAGSSSGGNGYGTYNVGTSVTGSGTTSGHLYFLVNPAPTNIQTATATAGQAFSYQVTSTLSGSLTWALGAGAVVPSWATLNSSGTITGTPPAGTSGTATFPVVVTDSLGNPDPVALTITWTAPPAPLSLPAATLASVIDQQSYSSTAIAATGGTGPYTYALATGSSLPVGLALDPATGALTGGTFAALGSYGFSVVVTDSASHTATQLYALTVMQANPLLPSATPPSGTVGVSYGTSIQATGSATISYSISAGSLPPGITQTGKNIGGTPTQVGTYTFSITASNDNTPYGSGSDTHSYTIVINDAPVSWSSVTAPGAVTVGVPYSWTASPAGSNITGFVISSGSLPAGLTFNTTTGVVSGTATASGSFPITIGATNSLGTVSQSYTLVSSLLAPTLPATLSATAAATGSSYSYQVSTTGGSPATSYSYTGTLPAGLSFSTSTGAITGTPSNSAVTSTIQVTATNSGGSSSAMALTIPVTNLPVYSSSTTTIAVGTAGASYSASVAPSGVGPFTYTVSPALPSGMSITSGALNGTAPAAGTYPVTITATNTNGSASTLVNWVVQAAPAAAASVTAPTATVGQSYSFTPTITGTALTYTATGLPSGWSINPSTGQITGTPGSAGSSTIVVTASNLVGSVSSTITVPAVTPPAYSPSTATMVAGLTGTAYAQSVPAPTTGTGPFTYAVTSGTLPAGLALNASTGVLSGTPTSVNGGTSTFTVTASNAVASAPVALTLTVNAPPSASSGVSFNAPTGTAVSTTVPMQGTGPFTFTLASGSLPAGVTMSSSGALSGTPTTAGATSATFTVMNGYGSTQVPVAITVGAAPVLPATTTLTGGTVGSAFAGTIVPTAGNSPFTFTVTSGSLPAGLVLNTSTGAVSGTPTTAGANSAVVTVTNSFGTATTTVGITIAAAPSVPSSGGSSSGGSTSGSGSTSGGSSSSGSGSSSTAPTSGTGSSSTGSTSGSGSASTGSSAGSTSGGSTSSGSTSGGSASGSNIGSAVTVATGGAASPVSATVGVAYSAALVSSSSAAAGTTYAVQGALPPGLAVNASTGVLSGTPTVRGTFTFTVVGTGPNGAVTMTTVTLVVNAAGAPSFALTPPTSSTAGATWSVPATGTGLTYTVRSGALPTGVTLDPGTGSITGSPSAPGIYQFVLSASNGSSSASQAYSVMITAPIGSVPDPNAAVALQLDAGAPVASAPAKISADGLLPGSAWTVVLHSKPVVLGTGVTATSGVVRNTVHLPAHVPAGVHHVVLSGVSMTGQLMTRTVEFVVSRHHTSKGASVSSGSTSGGSKSGSGTKTSDSGSGAGSTGGGSATTGSSAGGLASTGFGAAPLVGAGVLFALLGLALMLIARRRRRRA